MAGKYCVLVSELYRHDVNCKKLCEIFEVVWWSDFIATPDKFKDKIQGHLSLHSTVPYTLPEEMVASMKNLKVISVHGVGVDHLDIDMYKRLGVKVGNTPGVLNDCAADQGIALMLASARKLVKSCDLLRKGTFSYSDPAYLGKKFTGATLGIVGMGRIGYKIAERALGFQMKILYHNRNRRSEEDESRVHATYCSQLDILLRQSDFVVVVTPLNEHTKGMIGYQQLEKMKHNAIIVNIGRGPVINHNALVSALQAGKIGGAALDVTEPEPLPDEHPLLHMPNVIVTPHLGTATIETRKDMFHMCVENLKAGIENRKLLSEVLPSQ